MNKRASQVARIVDRFEEAYLGLALGQRTPD
jgi:hypothetical protein